MKAGFTELQFDHALLAAAGIAAAPDVQAILQVRPRMTLQARQPDLLPEDLEQLDAASKLCWPDVTLEASLRRELALAATLLLRSFARQLPGLGKSSVDYLWRNILSGGGMVRIAPGRIFVELAPRPLEIVLRMAGFSGMRFSSPWMKETEVLIDLGPQ